MALLNRIVRTFAIVETDGKATTDFQLKYQRNCESIEEALASLQDQIDLIAQAQAAADAANAAASAANAAAANAQAATDASASENSLVRSYPADPVGGVLISADNTGAVTIVDHDRIYGDAALNPTVPVAGDIISTGAGAGSIVRVYYDDPARSGGAVTYQFTIDPASPPVQGGDRHSVGAVEIPAAGSVDGGPVRPPGYANPIP